MQKKLFTIFLLLIIELSKQCINIYLELYENYFRIKRILKIDQYFNLQIYFS